MDYELERLHKEVQEFLNEAHTLLSVSQQNADNIENHLSAVMDEYYRVNKLSGQAGVVLDKFDRDFQEKTKLSSWEIVLLFTCVGLQCVRQYLLTNDKGRFKDTRDEESGKIKKYSNQKGDEFTRKIYDETLGIFVPPDWKQVLFQSVPYDAITKGFKLGGSNHRYRTLGHDPVLGWIFGTANIMTNSLTKYSLETYQVKDMTIIRHYPLGVAGMLDRAGKYASNDSKLLVASIGRQIIHYGSDMFTKQGLPIPTIFPIMSAIDANLPENSALKNFSEKMMSKMTKGNIDTYSILRGMGLAAFINKLIFIIHQFFYDENKCGSRDLYEVKTRKILSYSNLIASGSNILVSAVARDGKLLDVGGIIVTIIRLVSDYRFINRIKREFLEKEFYKAVVGDSYDFL